MNDLRIRRATQSDKSDWLNMRRGIWPEMTEDYLGSDLDEILASDRDIVYLALLDGQPVGMIEASLREWAEACESSPVGYIEGWFVKKELRGNHVAGALIRAAEDWARRQGCTEMASDTWLDNEVGIRAHARLGYREVERLVHFAKSL